MKKATRFLIFFILFVTLTAFFSGCNSYDATNLTNTTHTKKDESENIKDNKNPKPPLVKSEKSDETSEEKNEDTDNNKDTAYTDFISHYIDVGQGDSEFIELPNGECMLIDAGETDKGDEVTRFIKNLGYSKIDYIVCTHAHSDHIGGMEYVIKNFDVSKIYMPKKAHTSKTFLNLLSTIKQKGKKITTAQDGTIIFDYKNLTAKIVSPAKDYDSLNNTSAVVKIIYKNNSFLYMGDCETDASKDISENINADVLKVSHHGSYNGTNRNLIKRITPKYAVISCGEGNSYGHPHKEPLSLFEEYKTQVYRTDLEGTVTVTSDGNNIQIKTVKNNNSLSKENSTNSVSAAKTESNIKENTSSEDKNDIVYKTKSGKRYHRKGCSSLKKSCIETTRAEAEKEGLTPCKNCKP